MTLDYEITEFVNDTRSVSFFLRSVEDNFLSNALKDALNLNDESFKICKTSETNNISISSRSIDEVLDFCSDNDIAKELNQINLIINSIFYNLFRKNYYLSYDPELEEYAQVVLEIYVKDTVDNILSMQNNYYKKLFDHIEHKKIKYFVLKCEKYGSN